MEIRLKPFREIHATNLGSCSIKNEMESRGYVLIRELLPCQDLKPLLGEIMQLVYEAGWLLPDHDPLERLVRADAACGEEDPSYKSVYRKVFSLESFHALAHHEALQQVMKLLVGDQLLIHPKSMARLIFPNCARLVIPAHQDHNAIGGDPENFTAWIPLHDCPVELGPLQILEASHHYGLQPTVGRTGSIALETAQGKDWVGGDINVGDVLLFHSLTVHSATPNTSNQLRVSFDCRFQNQDRAINPAALLFLGPSSSRSWETTYSNWSSNRLKYYWKRMPLKFRPSRAELAELAQEAESLEMRSRYARTLSEIEREMPSKDHCGKHL